MLSRTVSGTKGSESRFLQLYKVVREREPYLNNEAKKVVKKASNTVKKTIKKLTK